MSGVCRNHSNDVTLQQFSNGAMNNCDLFTSTENPQMRKVDATSKKDGNRSPVVLKTVLAVTLEEPTEKQRRSTLNTSFSQEESTSPKLDSNKTVDNFSHLPGGFENTEHIPEEGQPQRSAEFVERVRFDKVHGLAENLWTESVPVKETFEPPSQNDSESGTNESAQHNSSLSDLKDISYSELNLSVDKIQGSDDLCVPSSGSLSDKVSVKEIGHDTEYEGITDTSQSDTKLNAHSEVVMRPSWCDELRFEDISEDSMDEKPLISVSPQDTQSKREQTQFTNGGYVHEQDVAGMKQESIPNEELIEESVPPKTFEQAHHNPHLSVNDCGNQEEGDYWVVIPVTISYLRYEPEEDEDQKGVVQPDDYKKKVSEIQSNKNETLWSGLTPTPTCASSKVEVFETGNSSEQVTGAHVRDKYEVGPSGSAHDFKVDNSGEPVLQKRRSDQNPDCSDSDDSCDTEDSCDYPSVSKHNHMTVSGHFFTEIPAPLSPQPLATAKKTEEQQDKNVPNGKGTGLNKFKEKLRKIIQRKNGTKHTTNGEKERSESSKDFSCDQHGIPSPEGADTYKDSSPSEDLQTLRGHPTHCATLSRGIMQDAQLSDRTGTNERQIVTEAEPEFVQHETKKRNTLNKATKITESDSKSKTDRNYKRKRKRKEKGSENSEDTSPTGHQAPQRLSTLHGEDLEEEDPCSDLQTETNADSVSDRHKITNDIIIIDSDTEDESDYYLINNAKKRTFSSSKTISKPARHKASDDVIILSDDESNINNKERHKTKTVTSGLADCNDTGCEQQLMNSTETGGIKFKAGKEKHKETTMPSVSSLHSSNLRDTQSKEPKQVGPYFTRRRKVQRRTTMQNVSKVSTDSDQECRRKRVSKKVSYQRRILSSTETEDSSDERMSPIEQRPSLESQESHSKTATRKPETDRPFPEDLSKKAHKSMDRGTDSALGFIPIIPTFSVTSLDPSQSRVKLLPLKKSSMVQATAIKPPLLSRQSSFPPYVGPSTSSSNMSSSSTPPKMKRRISVPSGDLPFSVVSRKASDPSNSRQNTYTSTPPSTTAKTQPSNSCRSPDQISSPTEGSSYSTTQLTRTRILKEWRSTFPNKGEVRRRSRRRPWLDDNLGTACLESSREVEPRPSWDKTKEARPGPSSDAIGEGRPGPSHSEFSGATRPDPLRAAGPEPRSRKRRVLQNKSFETTAPLMKKTKNFYSQLPKATNREPAQGQSVFFRFL